MTITVNSFKRAPNSYFISFEGIEGSGKSTQIQLLKGHFEDTGHNVTILREPGGTAFGEALREAILKSETKLDPIAEAHLFASARAQLLYEKILPKLSIENNVVLVDRFIDSSFCYQGFARKLGVDTVEQVHAHFPLTVRPDQTFYLKINYETSISRQNSRGNEKDYFEKEKEEFYNLLINGFDELSQRFSDRISSIEAGNTKEETFNNIIGALRI